MDKSMNKPRDNPTSRIGSNRFIRLQQIRKNNDIDNNYLKN